MPRLGKVRWRTWLALLIAVWLIVTIVRGAAVSKPPVLGHENGQLKPLPDKPNCVGSQAERTRQRMPALPLHADGPKATLDQLETVCRTAGGKIIQRDDDYLRVEFATKVMRFVDDVEWLIHDGQVHFRSASRVGYWDLGLNRRRMMKLSDQYNAARTAPTS